MSGINQRGLGTNRVEESVLSNWKLLLGAFYRRLRTRLGAPKAITATAHKIARIFYHLWTSGEGYINPGADYYEQRYRELVVKSLQKKAQALGMELVAQREHPTFYLSNRDEPIEIGATMSQNLKNIVLLPLRPWDFGATINLLNCWLHCTRTNGANLLSLMIFNWLRVLLPGWICLETSSYRGCHRLKLKWLKSFEFDV